MPEDQKYLFFSGKGGVGKTSLSSAVAVHLAMAGRRTLIITTDPASNLADVFEQKIGHKIAPISGVDNLFAMELDPDQAIAEYKERTLAPLRGLLAQTALDVIEEQLNSPCTTEMAAFERFVAFLDEDAFDTVVFDTAPTGHTLRLLELPADWTRAIEQSAQTGGATCVGPAQALVESKARFERALAVMKDPGATKFIFVVRPDASSIDEAQRAIGELMALGIEGFEVMANGIIPETAASNAFFAKKRREQLEQLNRLNLLDSKALGVLLLESEIKGIPALKATAEMVYSRPLLVSALTSPTVKTEEDRPVAGSAPPKQTVIRLNAKPTTGTRLLFFTGKGGVGKTVMSCIAAVDLAEQGRKVLLVTTDPAAHLAHVLGTRVAETPGQIPGIANLKAMRIDAKLETETYKRRILEAAKTKYPPERLAVMEAELDSPCTEEMAVFHRFIDIADSGGDDFVVFDTAPTGHTLRLLRLPVEWSKQLEIKTFSTKELSEADASSKSKFDRVIKRLQDPERASFIFVVYPEHTPIIEAQRAAVELASIGINPAYVIANQVLTPEQAGDGFFAKRREMQERYLHKMSLVFSAPVAIMPLLDDEPRGIEALRAAPLKFE